MLFKCNMEDGDDILEHLSNLRVILEQIHALSAQEFKISDLFFKVIISSSLPPSWDNFTQAYIAKTRCHATHDPFRNMSSTEFIGVIKSEAKRRLRRLTLAQNTHSAFGSSTRRRKGKGRASSPLLLKQITQEVTQKVQGIKLGDTENHVDDDKLFCKCCTKPGHKTDDCYLWNRKKCIHCDKFNHTSEDCYFKDKLKLEKKGKAKENSCKHSRTEEANAADSDHSYAAIEEVEEVSSGGITFNTLEHSQYFNFDNQDVTNYSTNDEHTLYYYWLADSTTTSHITN